MKTGAATVVLLSLAAIGTVHSFVNYNRRSFVVSPLAVSQNADTQQQIGKLTDEEKSKVAGLFQKSAGNDSMLQDMIAKTLPTMSPNLIMKLKQLDPSEDEDAKAVSRALQIVLNEKLAGGRDVLARLLEAGEIRKLDAEIGKAFRQGELDMAFFIVLNMNLRDATALGQKGEENNDNKASRASILKHINTRCQEEVEKTVPPGVALLNKLLRTGQMSIRANQLQHFLCPQPDFITLPDGETIPVKEGDKRKILVPPSEFVAALGEAVKQVRTIEKAGGTDRASAARMVESCRQLAKEARVVIAQNYGMESKELIGFEVELQPVFRPDSPESPYIQGQ